MKLNKKVLASVIAAGILTTGTALANPFDDVPKGHWAYDAVQSLADQGIVDGFGDGTYRGDKLMTRYEMAQIVARAMSLNKGTENPTLNKLSAEYADELSSLGVKVASLEKSTAGVKDLKINHWIQTENSYSNDNNSSLGYGHEYELEYRLTLEKQVSDKLSVLHQLETKTYFDDYSSQGNNNFGRSNQNGNQESVFTRLAYITYKPDANNTLVAGKEAVWLAGGLLGDDYLRGIDYTTKLSEKTSLQLIHGRYETNANWPGLQGSADLTTGDVTFSRKTEDVQLNYIGLNTKFGVVDFGAHYLTGEAGLVGPNESKVWAVTAGTDIGAGVNLSLGYAKSTEEDDNNSLTKVQLYKKLGKVDTFLQYWKQEENYNPAIENGCHMAFWSNQYGGNGIEGYRLILGYPVSANVYAEAWYGAYDATKEGVDFDIDTKFGWALTFSY